MKYISVCVYCFFCFPPREKRKNVFYFNWTLDLPSFIYMHIYIYIIQWQSLPVEATKNKP